MPTDLLILLSPKNVIIFLLVLTRLSGMLFSAPLFSTYPMPAQVKIWLVVAVSFIIYPFVLKTTGTVEATNMPAMIFLVFKEFSIGYLIGFLANLIFVGLQIGGEILSIQMGLSISNVLDPVTQTNIPTLAQLYVLPASLIFIAINAHHYLFMIVYQSFKSIPPGFEIFVGPAIVDQILQISTQIFATAFGLIFPIFGVLFVLEVLLGFVSKMMPQMNVFMIAMPLKVYIGLGLMVIFLAPVRDFIATAIAKQLTLITRIFTGG